MSEENLEVVRLLFPLGQEFDGREIADHPEMVRKLFEPLITEDFSVTFVAPGVTATFPGATGMSDGTREYMDAFLDYRTVLERHVDGENVVVALGHQYGTTHHGVEFKAESGIALFFVSEGRLQRIQNYQRWDEALEAAGLSE